MDAKGRTNHYLFYAQTLIKEISSPHQEEVGVRAQALEMSICLHLKQCWHAWLMELGQLVKLDLNAGEFFGQSEKAGEGLRVSSLPPELQYVYERLDHQDGWVSHLKSMFLDPVAWLADQGQRSQNTGMVKDRLSISVIDVDAEVSESIDKVLLTITNELKAYIHSVREQQTEW